MVERLVSLLEIELFGNHFKSYVTALAIFCGTALGLLIIRGPLMSRLQTILGGKFSAYTKVISEFFEKNIFPLLYVLAFYFAAKQLRLNPAVDKLIQSLLIIVLTIQGIRLLMLFLMTLMDRYFVRTDTRKQGASVISKSVLTIVKAVVWGLGTIFLLENLGFNVSSILAGLGIGGIAVAMASQAILGDLFNYFVIFFDKPFKEGDFIVSGEYMGTIEHLGLKSTRIRSLGGEEVIVSNTNLMSSWIRNYKRMNQRRVEFTIRLNHHTEQDDLRKVTGIIKQTIEGIQKTAFERSHFKAVDDVGLVIETAYYVLDAEYNVYMDIQQEINLKLRDFMLKENMKFASKSTIVFQEDPNPAK